MLTRDTTVGSTAISGGNIADTAPTASVGTGSAWLAAVSADTTNGALSLQVTGSAATNVRWVAQVEFTEIGYP